MDAACRSWWRNCALTVDSEIRAIDAQEDELAPLGQESVAIRELISSLEICHHKAERWVINILEAIGTGATNKGLGSRQPGQIHPAEQVWQDVCTLLSAWCSGQEAIPAPTVIGDVTASQLLNQLGQTTPLKKWQVQRVIERVGGFIHWPQSLDDPAHGYRFLLLQGGDYDCAYVGECPEYYRQDEPLWLQTAQTMIHDSEAGQPTELSLALAIDLLMPCHWDFIGNLAIVLAAIGGNCYPVKPFAACGRNIERVPNRYYLERLCATLKVFCGEAETGPKPDRGLLDRLGEASVGKIWLAASLEKTIRLQLNPPPDLRAISALTGPDWLKPG